MDLNEARISWFSGISGYPDFFRMSRFFRFSGISRSPRYPRYFRMSCFSSFSQALLTPPPPQHESKTWPHLNQIFPYFFIGFLTIIYKKPYKKQWFLIQFAKLDRFPTSTQNFSKKTFGHFRPFFAIILFFWPFQIKDRPQNINFHSTKNSRSPFFASKLNFFSPTSTTPFFQFCRFPDLRNSV